MAKEKLFAMITLTALAVAFLSGILVVGVLILLWNGKKGASDGMKFRTFFGDLNSFLLDSLRGLDETIQYDRGKERMEQIATIAMMGSFHDFIVTLPNGYDTQVGELGDTLSGGEKQRIGIARAFLHDAPFLLLNEPTSNLDALNEGMILKSLQEARGDRTVVLVSHRTSTMNLADVVVEMTESIKKR